MNFVESGNLAEKMSRCLQDVAQIATDGDAER
jgi:hypothetical protein